MNVFGPVQLYVADGTKAVDNSIFFPTHTGEFVVIVGVEGGAMIDTTISARALSQPFSVCETKFRISDTVVVTGVGAVVKPVPPVAPVYHNKPVPVAES